MRRADPDGAGLGVAALMAPDHVFVDSLGNQVAGWRGYFALCPDYWIRVDQVMAG